MDTEFTMIMKEDENQGMQINIIVFGPLTELTGSNSFRLQNIKDTDQMIQCLHHLYPALIHSKFLIAVEKQMITGNTILQNNDTIALLPPFSGG